MDANTNTVRIVAKDNGIDTWELSEAVNVANDWSELARAVETQWPEQALDVLGDLDAYDFEN